MFENEFVEWACRHPQSGAGVEIGPGDDAAVVAAGPQLLVTTDLLSEGVHFRLGDQPPEWIGRKALAVSLSDIAAMGGRPTYAVVQLLFPRSMELETAKRIQSGLYGLAAEFGVPVVGGDTNRWNEGLVIGTTVFGTPGPGGIWTLRGARAGDAILVSGAFGGSLAGHHFRFVPRVGLADELSRKYSIHGATDVSDSLSIDLANLADQSGLAALIQSDRIPFREAAWQQTLDAVQHPKETAGGNDADSPVPRPGSVLHRAMTDGEDFELILAVDPDTADAILADRSLSVPMSRIGSFEPGSGLYFEGRGGARFPFIPQGYEH